MSESETDLTEILNGLDVNTGGHVTVISNAEWSTNKQCYVYTVLDPAYPGSIELFTYSELILNFTEINNGVYITLWFPTVVTKTEYSNKTLLGEIFGVDYNSN